jgi:AAA+ ATPase superfamily predicted ATPase
LTSPKLAASSRNVVLYAPRRSGKSSLVANLATRLQQDGYLTAYADLFPITSEQEVVAVGSAILTGIGRGADPRTAMTRITNIFSRLMPAVEITPEGMSISAKLDRTAATEVLLDDVLTGLFSYLERTGKQACIVLDEFQEITELKTAKHIEGTLRAHIQRQETASFFFVGSRRHILKDIFTNKARQGNRIKIIVQTQP